MSTLMRVIRCDCGAAGELSKLDLETGLTARACSDCGGSLLALADYKGWRDKTREHPEAGDPIVFEDTPSARTCPCCARLMHRMRVGAKPDFRLDRCASCQVVWFDRGEWAALIAAGHVARLDDILSDAWQRQVQAEEVRARREAALKERYGEACVSELDRIRTWLDAQPQRDELIALLRAGW